MNAVPFDTLKLADRLQAGGFSAEQARTVAGALADAVSGAEIATRQDLSSLATKADLQAIKADLQTTKADVQAIKADLQTTKAELQAGLAEAKADILKWMVSAIGVQTAAILGAVIALVRLLH